MFLAAIAISGVFFAGSNPGALATSQYSVTGKITGQGTVSPVPGTYYYSVGQSVLYTATPSSGWKFDHWEWCFSGSSVSTSTSNPLNFMSTSINRAFTLTAVFVQVVHQVVRRQAARL